jgi:hypothetical protein
VRAPGLISFPNPVDEVSARLVAAGVVVLAALTVATGWRPLYLLLAYGFAARVLTGPRLSPLGLLVTRVVRPRLAIAPRLVPGPPKRFAQAVGLVFSAAAAVAALALGATGAAALLLVLLMAAASLEAGLGLCLGCRVFALLMRRGLVPAAVCAECSDLRARSVDAV